MSEVPSTMPSNDSAPARAVVRRLLLGLRDLGDEPHAGRRRESVRYSQQGGVVAPVRLGRDY